MNKKDLLLNAIEEMLKGNIDKTNAICENLDVLTMRHRIGYRSVKILSKTWEHYSGEEGYPVSGEFVWDKINCSICTARWSLLGLLNSEYDSSNPRPYSLQPPTG